MAKIKNDLSQKYSKGTIWIHWLSAIFIIALVLISLNVGGMDSLERTKLVKIHLFFGGSVFILTLFRSFLLIKTKQPEHLKTGSKIGEQLIYWNHYAFYILLLVVSFTGIVVLFQGNYFSFLSNGNVESLASQKEIPMLKYHVLMVLFIIVMLILHVLGVLKHLILAKENTLRRII